MSARRWAWGTLALHGITFTVPAVRAWTSTLDGSAALPLVALPTTLLVGLALLVLPRHRRVGAWVAGTTAVAALLELGAAVTLVLAYGGVHPGWDLS